MFLLGQLQFVLTDEILPVTVTIDAVYSCVKFCKMFWNDSLSGSLGRKRHSERDQGDPVAR
jgi:hypothetical protein